MITILYDGVDTAIKIEPVDIVFGVKITTIGDNFLIDIKEFDYKDIKLICKNLEEADEFISEFIRRKDEILNFEEES